MKSIWFQVVCAGALVVVAGGCGDDSQQCSLSDPLATCSDGRTCESVGGEPACVQPLIVRGQVTDPGAIGIADALVGALDANDAPASGNVKSDVTGSYELRIAAPRDADGKVLPLKIKLAGSAAGYDPFPQGIRRSLPIELSVATSMDGKLVVDNSATHIVLLPLASSVGLGSISGTVTAGTGKSGALIVAQTTGATVATAVSDTNGTYTIFNVPAGEYTVTGYASGLQLIPATANLAAGDALTGIDLHPASTPVGTVSGTVSIVNAPGGSVTSIVLVVESTFNDVLMRGDMPPGLRAPKTGAPNVANSFTIDGVPDGKYVVLAAFENDGLVRDPDTSIGGTQIQHITVGPEGRNVSLDAGFKVTAALTVISPGAGDTADEVTGTPVFRWQDDSSEDNYSIEVFDARGTLMWQNAAVPRVTSGDVSVTYGGPALTPGTYYQFRATSMKAGVPISQTEDLRGIFVAR